MPIDRSRYPSEWNVISKRIRERDGNRCKACRVENGTLIVRHFPTKTFMLDDGRIMDEDTGEIVANANVSSHPTGDRAIRVVLTVAHLDHDSSNNAEENLAALCQLHHLRLDAEQHAASSRATRRKRLADRELF